MEPTFHKGKKPKHGRIEGRFTPLPHLMLQSAQYRALTPYARSLLTDLTLQVTGHNNGALVLCQKAMRPLGWLSNDILSKTTKELEASGLIVKTIQRDRNRASRFALAWRSLDTVTGLDIDPKCYRQVVYQIYDPQAPKPTAKRTVKKSDNLTGEKKVSAPTSGIRKRTTAPTSGIRNKSVTPTSGAVLPKTAPIVTPTSGAYLEKPYPVVKHTSYRLVNELGNTLTNTLQSANEKESFNWAAKKVLALTAQAWLKSDTHPIVIQNLDTAKNATLDEFHDGITYHRDSEQRAAHWDCDAGEYRPPTAIQGGVKQACRRKVDEATRAATQSGLNGL